jgi:hypothetical protein
VLVLVFAWELAWELGLGDGLIVVIGIIYEWYNSIGIYTMTIIRAIRGYDLIRNTRDITKPITNAIIRSSK